MRNILIIEDDRVLGESLLERFNIEPYKAKLAENLAVAKQLLIEDKKFDLIILDVNLPDGNGLEFAKILRGTSVAEISSKIKAKTEMELELNKNINKTTPIIFLTAMNSAEFRLESFEIGAEDFIPKPFLLKELLLRIEKLFGSIDRKVDIIKINVVNVDDKFEIIDEGMIIKFKDGSKEFPQKRDFDLLKYLIAESPRIISREEIVKELWKEGGDDVSFSTLNSSFRIVDNSIVRIRGHLREEAKKVRSVRGMGYQWG